MKAATYQVLYIQTALYKGSLLICKNRKPFRTEKNAYNRTKNIKPKAIEITTLIQGVNVYDAKGE